MRADEIQVDRDDSSSPIYRQIANALLRQIERGDFPSGSRIPTERVLSEKYDVNRMTVRHAIQVLEQDGLIVRRVGAGTYVTEPKFERQAAKLISFTKGMRQSGYMPGARVVEFRTCKGEIISDDELGEFSFDHVYHIHRLRLINQEPVLLERLVIPADLFLGFDCHDLALRSLYEVMETEYGIRVAEGVQGLEAVAADANAAQLLNIEPGAPLMLEKRLSLDHEGRAVEYGRDLYRGDRFRFMTQMAELDR